MNKMIAVTIRPGATTAAARLICPFACSSPPPAAARTSAKVPSNSENSRRHSRRGSSKSARSPNSSVSMWCVRGNAVPSAAGSVNLPGRRAAHTRPPPARPRACPDHPSRLTGTLSVMPRSFPSTAPTELRNEDRKLAPSLVFGEAFAGHREESPGIQWNPLPGPYTSARRQHQSTWWLGEFHRPDGMKKDRHPRKPYARHALPLFIPSVKGGRCALFLSATEWALCRERRRLLKPHRLAHTPPLAVGTIPPHALARSIPSMG